MEEKKEARKEETKFSIKDLLPTVLDIDVHHYVRDQSVATNYDESVRIDSRDIRVGDLVDTGSLVCGKLMVIEITEESITLIHIHSKEKRTLKLEEEWVIGPYVIDNSPYISSDEITMTIKYDFLTPWEQIPEIMDKIIPIHENATSSVIPETVDDEERVLALLDLDLELGDVGSYPLKALLSACNNWHTAKIVRLGQFQEILLEGIEKGALAPDDETGWSWMKVAAETNDPETFMTDMDRYYDLLASAVENGNTDALDIMNTIWEPEQIIEED